MRIFHSNMLNNKTKIPPFLTPCRVKAAKTTSNPHAVNSGASRERTASVGRQHGELGLLIKIFYKSACAVHMRDNRPEWGGGAGRILKQLPLWKPPPKKQQPQVDTKSHMMKEYAPPHVYPQGQSQASCFCSGGRKTSLRFNAYFLCIFVFQAREGQRENNSTLWLKDNAVDEGVAPLVWRFGEFPILISHPAPCNGRWHLLY